MAVRGLVKVLKAFFSWQRLLSKNDLRINLGPLVKVLENFFSSDNEYFPKMALELL